MPASLFHSAVPGIRAGLRGDPETDTCKWKVAIIRPIKYSCVWHLLPPLSFIYIWGPSGCLFSITSEFKSVRAALIASVPRYVCALTSSSPPPTPLFAAAIVMHEAPIFTSCLTRQHGSVINLFCFPCVVENNSGPRLYYGSQAFLTQVERNFCCLYE